MADQLAPFPAEFPGAWQNIPRPIQRSLVAQLLARELQLREGAAGLIESLYRGRELPMGRVSYLATAAELWPLVVEDTKVRIAERLTQATKGDE